ncbi:MAG: hypothetical protein LBJ17_05745 [Dysgonamonadaceae bacterium]|nr:hypothetical protein [Dysgonamonadaceae bacterium]
MEIFNITTKCVETWSGVEWIQKCAPVFVTCNANGGTGADIKEEAGSAVRCVAE